MDRATFHSIIQLMMQNRLPKDDTVLEKMISYLELNSKDLQNVLKDDCFVNLCDSSIEALTNSSLAAITRIVGALCASSNSVDNDEIVTLLLKHCVQPDRSQDASVACSWLYTLTRISRSSPVKIDHVLKHNFEFVDQILAYCEHSSLFTAKLAKKLSAYLILNTVDLPEDNTGSTGDGVSEQCLNVFSVMKGRTQCSLKILTCVEIIHEILLLCEAQDSTAFFSCPTRSEFLNVYMKWVGEGSHLLEFLLSSMTIAVRLRLLSDNNLECLTETPGKLLKDGKRKEAITVALWLHKHLPISRLGMEELLLAELQDLVEAHTDVTKADKSCVIKCLTGMATFTELASRAVSLLLDLLSPEKRFSKLFARNKKLLSISFETINALLQQEQYVIDRQLINRVWDYILRHMQDNTSSYQGFSQCLSVVQTLLTHRCDENDVSTYTDLKSCLTKKLLNHDMWEIRETSMQFLADTASVEQGEKVLTHLLNDGEILKLVWNSLCDEESYVRATAVSTIESLINCPLSAKLLWLQHSQEDIFASIQDILQQDSEAFPRRAAVKLLTSLHRAAVLCSSTSLQDRIATLVCDCTMKDLDYEVKLSGLLFWKQHFVWKYPAVAKAQVSADVTNVTAHSEAVLSDSDDIKITETDLPRDIDIDDRFVTVLLRTLQDHDKKVALRACELFCFVREHYDVKTGVNPGSTSPCKRRKQSTKSIEQFTSIDTKPFPFMDFVRSLDVDCLIETASQSDDQYVANPRLLFDDLLHCLSSAPGTETKPIEFESVNESLVDCY